jgi:hypothetical protein
MMQHRCGASFSAKPRERGVVCNEFSQQDLDSYNISDMHTTSTIDDTHATLSEERSQFILSIDGVTN